MMALDPDKLLAPYLREAGLAPKAESYGNWENTGLDGHIGGHYLSALSLMYASTGDHKALERLDYMLGELKKCQDKNGDGYLGGVPGSRASTAMCLCCATVERDVTAARARYNASPAT